ncbi:MAG: Flagellar hook-basal body complex protein FliE, partial [Pseudomonadota bacterium]
NQAQTIGAASSSSGSVIQNAFSSIPKTLRHDEDVKRRAIINEASISEVIAATSEAKTVLQTAVAVRNKIFDAFDKIMNMPL